MGLSLFICVQNYTAQHGGIPKAIRDNVSTMMLYKTRSSNVLKTIMEDISDQITDEEFFYRLRSGVSRGARFSVHRLGTEKAQIQTLLSSVPACF